MLVVLLTLVADRWDCDADKLIVDVLSGLYCLVLTDYFQRIVTCNEGWRGSWGRGSEGLTKG